MTAPQTVRRPTEAQRRCLLVIGESSVAKHDLPDDGEPVIGIACGDVEDAAIEDVLRVELGATVVGRYSPGQYETIFVREHVR